MKITNHLKNGFAAGLIAAAGNVALYFAARMSGIINDEVLLPDGAPLQLAPVIISSLISGIVAALVLWIISRFKENPTPVFTGIGLAFLVVSMAGPLITPNLTAGFRVVLIFMHLIAGLIIIYRLRKKSAQSEQ